MRLYNTNNARKADNESRAWKCAVTVFVLSFLIVSCSKNRDAKAYLSQAEANFRSGNYAAAKLKIDSIKILFPKAYDEISQGFELMQKVRFEENKRNIAFCDSMLEVSYAELQALLKLFTFVRDPNYQEFGVYVPKSYAKSVSLNQSGLRAEVSEKGKLYLESVLADITLRHNRIKVSTPDNSYAETLSVTSDGLNYRFKTLSQKYEIVRFTGKDENGVSQFVYTFSDKPLTIHFVGERERSFKLSEASKKGVAQAYELSTLLLNIENLKFEKERSEVLLQYLASKHK